MNILHLLSQNHLTGAEVYATELIRSQAQKAEHQVYQISNQFFTETMADKTELEVEAKSKLSFIKSVLWLRKYLELKNIHIIHSHSRAAAKMAFYATLFNRTAHISTVHGQQHSSISKKIFNQYGQIIIAVCDNIKTHLIRDFKYNDTRIHVVPNPISEIKYHYLLPQTTAGLFKICIIGRGTGPKADRTAQVLKSIFSFQFEKYIEVTLIGASLDQININAEIKSKVKVVDEIKLTSQTYTQYDCIIGSGRVCMEALISGVTSIAFGEACYIGLLTIDNIDSALESNFGDIHPDQNKPQIDKTKFQQDLILAMQLDVDHKSLSEKAAELFNSSAINKHIERLYESAFFLKNYPHWIPVLMYHKIPDTEINSQHKIFVVKENFEKHLNFYKKSGFTTLTFADLTQYRKAQIDFKKFPRKPIILTFDDGYRDNLTNASPLLKKYGFKAQLFLLADQKINSNNWDASLDEPLHEIISGQDRQAWLTSAFEIGSHGFRHQKIDAFEKQNAILELAESKKSLEVEFKRPVNVFAFTYGTTTKDSPELAQKANYDYAVNTDTGGLLIEENPYAIFRVNMFPNENIFSLYKKTSRWYRRYYLNKRKK